VRTRDQERAQKAYECVRSMRADAAQPSATEKTYRSFALSFPALIHGSGLAQAVSFAEAKGHESYLKHLGELIDGQPQNNLGAKARRVALDEYIHISRSAVACAGWLKRYSEALLRSEDAVVKKPPKNAENPDSESQNSKPETVEQPEDGERE